MKFRKPLSAVLLAAALIGTGSAYATALSAQSSVATSIVGSVIVGSAALLTGSDQVVIESIEQLGNDVVYMFKNLSNGARASVQVSGTIIGGASVAVGTSVTVVADASGHALMASGKMIAYIPNEIGQSLLHNKKAAERATSAEGAL